MNNEQRTFESFLLEIAKKEGYESLSHSDGIFYLGREKQTIKMVTEAAQRFAAWKARTTAIAFAEWCATNSVFDSLENDWVSVDKPARAVTTSELFDTFSGLPVEQGQKADGWISVDDSLPAYGMNVLIFNTDGGIHICYRGLKKGMTDGEWRYGMTSSKYNMSQIEYWQPLPALPLQVNKDNNE